MLQLSLNQRVQKIETSWIRGYMCCGRLWIEINTFTYLIEMENNFFVEKIRIQIRAYPRTLVCLAMLERRVRRSIICILHAYVVEYGTERYTCLQISVVKPLLPLIIKSKPDIDIGVSEFRVLHGWKYVGISLKPTYHPIGKTASMTTALEKTLSLEGPWALTALTVNLYSYPFERFSTL